MPKRTDIHTILLIGSGPIVIGQACEFDYSGTQACKALKEEGYRIVLLNSNPATIMTDPDLVDATYIEPMTVEVLEKIIQQEKPDAILPTMGGQTALNLAIQLSEQGILEKYNIKLIGASVESIHKAEDRQKFNDAMNKIGLRVARSQIVHSWAEAEQTIDAIGLPIIVRPSFTLGGTGGGVAETKEQLKKIVDHALQASPSQSALLEESVLGWKEYEFEVVRDCADNVVIICSVENLDPMGVHTGDSITVAPSQTLTDREYQKLRDASIAVIREIGVDTGGSNIQFAVNPETGDSIVIEMNPRVSRSSALASKATGFPIAKIAAKLSVGYTLDELPNDITQKTPACFEPALDYVVVKIPRFAFEKFPHSNPELTTQMKSVGEAMAIGGNFREALQKALRSLEVNSAGFEPPQYHTQDINKIEQMISQKLQRPTSKRLWYVADALRRGWTEEKVHDLSKIDPWFIRQIAIILELEDQIRNLTLPTLSKDQLQLWKKTGFSDQRIADLLNCQEVDIKKLRSQMQISPVFKQVDTCAAEFPSETSYFYSTYAQENESVPSQNKKIIILGSGPNRIGQGIEFDYCCVHASMALQKAGYESIMINCNPETVSTDYDVSDRLYFEPITFEDVMHIIELEKPDGVIIQLGGQTPLKLAKQLSEIGVPILGTSFDSIDRCEDRERFIKLLQKLNLYQPANGMASSEESAQKIASQIGYPILVRPSYVLGGRAMAIIHNEKQLSEYFAKDIEISKETPALIDKFLNDAIEVDVDVICDGNHAAVCGVMEHIELAGVHSGDSACVVPPYSLSQEIIDTIRSQSRQLAKELQVIGLMNLQFAVRGKEIYVIEVNPRASRTAPFVSKARGVSFIKYATRLMLGETLEQIGYQWQRLSHYAVKETVFPFTKFEGTDTTLGPEMLSTGEVMGIGDSFAQAYYKSQLAVYHDIAQRGYAFINVINQDHAVLELSQTLQKLGYCILTTQEGTKILNATDIELTQCTMDSQQENCIEEYIIKDQVAFIIDTTESCKRFVENNHLRRLALFYNLPYFTTIEGAKSFVLSLQETQKITLEYRPLQQLYTRH